MKKTKMKVKCVWSKSRRMKAGKIYTAKGYEGINLVALEVIGTGLYEESGRGYYINKERDGSLFVRGVGVDIAKFKRCKLQKRTFEQYFNSKKFFIRGDKRRARLAARMHMNVDRVPESERRFFKRLSRKG